MKKTVIFMGFYECNARCFNRMALVVLALLCSVTIGCKQNIEVVSEAFDENAFLNCVDNKDCRLSPKLYQDGNELVYVDEYIGDKERAKIVIRADGCGDIYGETFTKGIPGYKGAYFCFPKVSDQEFTKTFSSSVDYVGSGSNIVFKNGFVLLSEDPYGTKYFSPESRSESSDPPPEDSFWVNTASSGKKGYYFRFNDIKKIENHIGVYTLSVDKFEALFDNVKRATGKSFRQVQDSKKYILFYWGKGEVTSMMLKNNVKILAPFAGGIVFEDGLMLPLYSSNPMDINYLEGKIANLKRMYAVNKILKQPFDLEKLVNEWK